MGIYIIKYIVRYIFGKLYFYMKEKRNGISKGLSKVTKI